jgi:hypothetical protein
MPVSKKPYEKDQLAKLHARVCLASGFDNKNLKRGENRARVAGMLKQLETMGLILHVDGWGWVDSSSVVERYGKYTGVEGLLATAKRESERTKFIGAAKEAGDDYQKNPTKETGGGNPDWDSYGSPGRKDKSVDYPYTEYERYSHNYNCNGRDPKCAACVENNVLPDEI